MNRRRQRLRCLQCQKRFSSNFYSLDYRNKKSDPGLNSKIFLFGVNGLSNRAIGRIHNISAHCVRLRLLRLSQRSLIFHHEMIKNFKIDEPICFDGLENFASSQYDPNNVQQALGRDSLFIYDFNFASMNRKGRTSAWQKNRNSQIEAEFGRYNPSAIRVATGTILRRLFKKSAHPKIGLTLLSDEHFQYRRAIKEDLKDCTFEHVTINSKVNRNFQNILFNVNHADLRIRQLLASFIRETISFSKTAGAMCQKYALFLVYKNYMAPQFTKKHVRRPEAHIKSPAEHLGLCSKTLSFSEVFSKRSFASEAQELNEDWMEFWHGRVPKAFHRSQSYRKSAKVLTA